MTVEPHLAGILLIVFFSTFIRSTFGFGDALLAMPLLTLLIGIQSATPLVALIASTIAFSILIKEWRRVDLRSAWRLIVSTLAGIPIGLLLLKGTHDFVLKTLLALLIIGFAGFALLRPKMPLLKTESSAFVFGFLAGILGGAYNTNGPPVVIYGSLRRWPPETFRATLQGYFFPTGLMILIGHWSAGLWTDSVLNSYLAVLPVVLAAVWIGGRIHRIIPKGRFERAVYVLLILIGGVLLWQSLAVVLTK